MSRWSVLRTAALTYFTVKAVILVVNAATFPRLQPAAPARRPRVSLLIPARDEAATLPVTLPGVLAQGADEVIVLDDGSADGTADIARSLGARVLTGQPLPPGWVGKPWACQQLAQAATGDLLIFTDADVRWHPGALDAVLHAGRVHHADLLTVLPRAENLRGGARVLTPLVDVVVLTWLPYPLLQLPLRLATTAHGAVMAVRAGAYHAVGGHACVRGDLLEDTQLARHLKAAGRRVVPALGQELIGIHMYGTYAQSVAGFSKNARGVHLGSRALMVALAAWHVAAYTLPWLRPARTRRDWMWRVLTLLERPAVNVLTRRTAPADLAEALLSPLTPLAALPAYRRALSGVARWKGRTYRQ
ncbi:glycosyltransferase family 2 protein [Deinococcus rufus]|uniref:Glycosyltransferase family 2 protein n=1 Tax=Deinococcus rufus TaxID=2136097 RepID=A0ABV7ZE18_9DEIO